MSPAGRRDSVPRHQDTDITTPVGLHQTEIISCEGFNIPCQVLGAILQWQERRTDRSEVSSTLICNLHHSSRYSSSSGEEESCLLWRFSVERPRRWQILSSLFSSELSRRNVSWTTPTLSSREIFSPIFYQISVWCSLHEIWGVGGCLSTSVSFHVVNKIVNMKNSLLGVGGDYKDRSNWSLVLITNINLNCFNYYLAT